MRKGGEEGMSGVEGREVWRDGVPKLNTYYCDLKCVVIAPGCVVHVHVAW